MIAAGYFPGIKATQMSLFVQSLDLPHTEIAERSGVSVRTLERIVRGEVATVKHGTADALVTAFEGDPTLLEAM